MASLTRATDNILEMVEILIQGMYGVFYIVGIALLLSALIQYKQHRDNPMAVPISKPIVLLLLGVIAILLPAAGEYLH